MKSVQGVTVVHGSAGTKVNIGTPTGDYGNTYMLTNTGTVTLGLGGSGDDNTTCNRCLPVGATVIFDTSETEDPYLFVPTGVTDGLYDGTRMK